MRKRRWMICAALVCLAMACGGCADKQKEANTAVIEGDDIKGIQQRNGHVRGHREGCRL